MPFMPFNILGIWLRGLLSVVIIAAGIYLLSRWYETSHKIGPALSTPITAAPETGQGDLDGRSRRFEVVRGRRVFRFEPGANKETAYLAGGIALLLWATVGGLFGRSLTMLMGNQKQASGRINDDPRDERTGEVHELARPDGSKLRVECYGPADAPPIVFSHGWGANSTEWYYPKKSLAGKYRLIVWDEPGMGLSKKPDNNDYRMENLAADLDVVLSLAGGRPTVLVGHSIGGMITLTFCKTFSKELSRRVAGLVLVHTTYTNPVRTTKWAPLYTALEKPLIIPLLYLTIATWPLAWLMNWLSYVNGSAHQSTHKSSFAGTETPGQLTFCARFMPHARPDVLARGMLGMIAYDATQTLSTIPVPTLVVVGDKDTTTPPEAGRYIASHVPRAQLATLAPARHMGLIEWHETFDAMIDRFAVSCLSPVASGTSR